MRTFPQRQRGVALLVALLVVALAVILIVALLDRGELALARTRNSLRTEQAEAYAQGLEIYAAQILIATSSQGQADTNASPWAQPLPPQPVPGGVIGATMRDMNGCFNLNNLAPNGGGAGVWLQVFQKMLTVRGLDPTLGKAVVAWLDVPASSADENYYLAQPVPYRMAHQNFAHVSELRLVRGFNSDVYSRLAPDLCALPAGTKININTASVLVLQGIGMSQANAERFWQNGNAQHTAVGSEFRLAAQIPEGSPLLGLLDVKSHYFLARGDIQLDGVPFTFHSLIHFDDGSGVQAIARSRGSDDALTSAVVIDADHDDTLH